MACPCQTSSLRAVIRSLTQLGVAETRTNPRRLASSTARVLVVGRTQPAPAPPTPRSAVVVASPHGASAGASRGFHSALAARSDRDRATDEDDEEWSTDDDPFLGMPGYEGAGMGYEGAGIAVSPPSSSQPGTKAEPVPFLGVPGYEGAGIAVPPSSSQARAEAEPDTFTPPKDYAPSSQPAGPAAEPPAEPPAEPAKIMTRPPASSTDEFVKRLKKALRSAKRMEQIIKPFDPTPEKKKGMEEEYKASMALREMEKKTEARLEAKKQAGEDLDPEWWRKHKLAMKKRFPEGWNPRKKVSPDAMEGIKALNKQFPDAYPTWVLAEKFEISPEAVRRILKSNWRPKAASAGAGDGGVGMEELAARWTERGMRVWTQNVAFGLNPPRKWEKLGIKRDMLQVGQRDAQEGNRRNQYWKDQAEAMKDEYSDRYRRQQQWLGVQQEHDHKGKSGGGVGAKMPQQQPDPVVKDRRLDGSDDGLHDDGLHDEDAGLPGRLSNTL